MLRRSLSDFLKPYIWRFFCLEAVRLKQAEQQTNPRIIHSKQSLGLCPPYPVVPLIINQQMFDESPQEPTGHLLRFFRVPCAPHYSTSSPARVSLTIGRRSSSTSTGG